MSTTDSMLELSHGDPAMAEALKVLLRRLRNGRGGTVLQEMARDVLAGRIDPRMAANSDVYGEELSQRAEGFVRWYENLTPGERERIAGQVSRQIRDLGRGR